MDEINVYSEQKNAGTCIGLNDLEHAREILTVWMAYIATLLARKSFRLLMLSNIEFF